MKNKMNLILTAVMSFVIADGAHALTYAVSKPTTQQLISLYTNSVKPNIDTYVASSPTAQAWIADATARYNDYIVSNPAAVADLNTVKDKVASWYNNLPSTFTISI